MRPVRLVSKVRLVTGKRDRVQRAPASWGGIRIKEREESDPAPKAPTVPGFRKNAKCPDCGGKMAVRKNRANNTTFLGCKAYPGCKGTLGIAQLPKAKHQHGTPAPP